MMGNVGVANNPKLQNKAITKLLSGPASVLIMIPLRKFLKLCGEIGTGLA